MTKGSRAVRIYHGLREQIMLGAREAGTAVTEIALAREFDASQGTVREALMRLAEDGLVVRDGYRGTHVATISVDEAEALLALRLQLERRGIVRARAVIDSDGIDELAALIDAMREQVLAGNDYALVQRDHDFHLTLFRHAELPLLAPVLSRCMLHIHRLSLSASHRLRNDDEHRDAMLVSVARHSMIVDALREGSDEQAQEVIDDHIRTVWQAGLRGLVEATTPR
ncbi:GntR family transcriptional regulator [Kushneria aurantia]|uniref:GntR family transcriptional regulator n=1 Tax=Kushneria aurantia TaxID=504092 RepID=A0ABV6G335_9GAMM|nr:GntR family transcriptional regulator [Kushneria aurantia]